jgi:hypothetical protein
MPLVVSGPVSPACWLTRRTNSSRSYRLAASSPERSGPASRAQSQWVPYPVGTGTHWSACAAGIAGA